MFKSNSVLSVFFAIISMYLFFLVNHSINQYHNSNGMYVIDYNVYIVQLCFLFVMCIMFLIGSIVCYLSNPKL